MNIGAVNSSNITYATQVVQPQPEAAEVKGGPDHDGDADDGGAGAIQQSQPSPTVNLNGQKIGQIVNVAA